MPEIMESTTYGQCDFKSNLISLSLSVGGDELAATIFHEYFHAKIYDLGLNLGISEQQQEKDCQLFSTCVMELIKDNWKLLEWAKEQK